MAGNINKLVHDPSEPIRPGQMDVILPPGYSHYVLPEEGIDPLAPEELRTQKALANLAFIHTRGVPQSGRLLANDSPHNPFEIVADNEEGIPILLKPGGHDGNGNVTFKVSTDKIPVKTEERDENGRLVQVTKHIKRPRRPVMDAPKTNTYHSQPTHESAKSAKHMDHTENVMNSHFVTARKKYIITKSYVTPERLGIRDELLPQFYIKKHKFRKGHKVIKTFSPNPDDPNLLTFRQLTHGDKLRLFLDTKPVGVDKKVAKQGLKINEYSLRKGVKNFKILNNHGHHSSWYKPWTWGQGHGHAGGHGHDDHGHGHGHTTPHHLAPLRALSSTGATRTHASGHTSHTPATPPTTPTPPTRPTAPTALAPYKPTEVYADIDDVLNEAGEDRDRYIELTSYLKTADELETILRLDPTLSDRLRKALEATLKDMRGEPISPTSDTSPTGPDDPSEPTPGDDEDGPDDDTPPPTAPTSPPKPTPPTTPKPTAVDHEPDIPEPDPVTNPEPIAATIIDTEPDDNQDLNDALNEFFNGKDFPSKEDRDRYHQLTNDHKTADELDAVVRMDATMPAKLRKALEAVVEDRRNKENSADLGATNEPEDLVVGLIDATRQFLLSSPNEEERKIYDDFKNVRTSDTTSFNDPVFIDDFLARQGAHLSEPFKNWLTAKARLIRERHAEQERNNKL